MKKLSILMLIALLAAVMLTACQPKTITETIIETVVVEKEGETIIETIIETVEVEVPVEVEVEVPAEAVEKTVIEFWTTDNEEDRVDVYDAIATAFMAEHPEIDLRIIPIEEAGIAQRIATAQAANRLPDIVRMGIERVSTFAADGILDEDAAVATIASIGEDDFRAGPLGMVVDPATGKYAAVPFDGWIQAIW
ncbi:MAG: extracellular solute-binding protein, partial [Chloroflexi bacterium]|nr:extracellular solute-binding protein [Chloroflexota bacterium]